MNYHSDMKQIATALIKAQKEMGNATKDSLNPFYKNRYADLNAIREACMPALNDNGIAVLQPTVHIEGKNFVRTVLLHESGETFESLTEIIYNKVNDAQSQGSGITYARRYGLQSLVNVGAEDDDGNNASSKESPNLPSTLTRQNKSTLITEASASSKELPHLPSTDELFKKAKKFIQEGGHINDIKKKYTITKEVETLLNSK